ncbi:glycosyl transferase family 1 [Halalkaliarchaeum desulfuricum]|uniref:Glycosyl transferase family 1 n=1 Tax=Halalkaliarchaeum desulfuricum TaxID=2055893 RepID=A0A343TGG9_9EURY|nr:glycosyltransferase family 4 protein [Halalkaliarchaeum desulfuricum]AUX08191.1 glycosyl transferase family 1 [Halalkaliarchaeum desulfuricum]
MRVCSHLELGDRLDRSGIGAAASHQRRALSEHVEEVQVVAEPWAGGSLRGGVSAAIRGRYPLRDIDVVHCNLPGPAALAIARLARRRGVPVVFHAHVTSEDFAGSFRGSTAVAPALRRYLRRAYSLADLVLCPSEYTKRRLEGYPIDAPIEPITNGVDLASLEGHSRLGEEYRRRFGLSGTVVFSVGNVFARKGVGDFCRLAGELQGTSTPAVAPGDGAGYEFAWFGPYDTGPQASSPVRRWLRSHPSNVTFTGWVDDKRGAFGAGDIYLFPTHEENQGIAALEAMACGKPVVMRDLPVFREYYEHGHDCLLCADRAEMREAIQRLAGDRALRERLGANARDTARDHGLDQLGERLAGIYRELLERNTSD